MKLSLATIIRVVLIILIVSTVIMFLFWTPHAIDHTLDFVRSEQTDTTRTILFAICAIITILLLMIFAISFNFCSEIATDTIFSQKTAARLRLISIMIFIDCAIFTTGIVWLFCLGERVLSPALAFVDVIGFTVALMLSVLSRYVHKAAILKEETDHTL